MSGTTIALALTALIPAISGPIPIANGPAVMLEMLLCNGGTMSLPVERDTPAVPASTPCCAKGCHSRKRSAGFDPAQGL